MGMPVRHSRRIPKRTLGTLGSGSNNRMVKKWRHVAALRNQWQPNTCATDLERRQRPGPMLNYAERLPPGYFAAAIWVRRSQQVIPAAYCAQNAATDVIEHTWVRYRGRGSLDIEIAFFEGVAYRVSRPSSRLCGQAQFSYSNSPSGSDKTTIIGLIFLRDTVLNSPRL